MKSLLRTARGLKSMVTLVRDPNRLNDVFVISESLQKPVFLQRMVDHVKKIDEVYPAEALATRPRVGQIDLDELLAYPEGTVGHEFAAHMRANGLDPSALPTAQATDEKSFLYAHLYETHDIWHTITGFHTDVAGELGLQAFYLAQLPTRLAGILLSGGLINMMMYNFDDRDRRMTAIAKGWTMGKNARPLFGIDWRLLWGETLADVRARYLVDPVLASLLLLWSSRRSSPASERAAATGTRRHRRAAATPRPRPRPPARPRAPLRLRAAPPRPTRRSGRSSPPAARAAMDRAGRAMGRSPRRSRRIRAITPRPPGRRRPPTTPSPR
jgi:ubiquinone biosynthesis protein Coq4